MTLPPEFNERKRLEEELERREWDLTQAKRLAGLGTWRWTRHDDTVTWSDEIYHIFGADRSRQPATYRELMAMEHAGSMRTLVTAFDRAVRLGEPYSVDLEIAHPDGSARWIVCRGEVEAWENGEVASLRGTVQEITERKRIERETALRENRYRSLVHATSQIVWTTNAQGEQAGNPPSWQAFTGQSAEEVRGFGWADAIHPEDRGQALSAWRHAIQTGQTYQGEERLRRSDGVYRSMAVRAVPVRDESGEIVEWVGIHTDITEQKVAQEESRVAHQRLRTVFDSITDGLCVIDRDMRYIYYNEAGARISGLRAADIVGKQVGDIFSENKTNDLGRAYRRAMETGETIHFENLFVASRTQWIECNCYPSPDGLTVYFRDVTERKRTEEALRESESRYRKLFESNMMGIARPDRFGAFKESNDELLRMVGYTRAELEAGLVRWDTMTPPEYAALDAEHIAEAAERGNCTPYEKEYIRKDGTRVPILCGYALLEGSNDEYVGFVYDLSRQRAAEAAMREREQRFGLLAEVLPDLVWVSDPAGSLLYLNQRFLDYCGIRPEQMAGYDWRNFLHPEEIERVFQTWTDAVTTGQQYLIDLRMRRHDGVFRHFLVRSLAMRNEAGEVERWVGSCTDIHDQKLADEALRRSEKLAATGRLAASIAHEINNPLSSVMNALYLALQDRSLSEKTRDFLKTADAELARVAHITTQTLRFHRQSKAAASSDLGEIMQSVITLFGPRLMARDIELRTEWAPGLRICCFEDEMRQVFANLVGNALDALPDSGRLWIRIREACPGGVAGARITVADTGCGIPREIQKRIFEPFFSTKDTVGIGLGLWVSEGIIRKHSGRLSLRSSTAGARHGTVFSLFFPQNGVG